MRDLTEKEVLFPELENVPLSAPWLAYGAVRDRLGGDGEAEYGREPAAERRLEM